MVVILRGHVPRFSGAAHESFPLAIVSAPPYLTFSADHARRRAHPRGRASIFPAPSILCSAPFNAVRVCIPSDKHIYPCGAWFTLRCWAVSVSFLFPGACLRIEKTRGLGPGLRPPRKPPKPASFHRRVCAVGRAQSHRHVRRIPRRRFLTASVYIPPARDKPIVGYNTRIKEVKEGAQWKVWPCC